MAFLFSGLYEVVPDIDLYLERIGYHGDRRPTLDNLKELVIWTFTGIRAVLLWPFRISSKR